MKQSLLILCAVLCISVFTETAQGQTSERPWAVGLYAGASHYDGELGNSFFSLDPFQGFAGLSLGRYLSPSFDVELRGQEGRLGYTEEGVVAGRDFLVDQTFFNLSLHYKFLKDTKFKPYITAGLGYSSFERIKGQENRGRTDESFAIPLGLGFDWNFSEYVGLTFQTYYGLNFSDEFDRVSNESGNDAFYHTSAGFKFNIGKMEDADGDGVSDKKDECPNTPGLKEFNGCPDTDGDGLADKDDDCPNVAGLMSLMGCPDTDGDGIADKDDKCPDAAGTAAMMGCPDTDGDGVADIEDDCPKVAGLKTLKGCPDADGDGVADKDDKCPKEKGTKATKGCPDRDGDGVADADDKCPDVKGIASMMGCPDTDGDGITDADDKCPKEKGTAENGGCPVKDTDGDGVEDSKDRCPTIKGLASNGGCPEIKVEDKEVMQEALEGVYFNTSKATIKTESYAVLDQVVAVMARRPSYKINIDGHTDSDGAADFNHTLSHKRANAVRDYLVSKGVSPSRLNTKGYGETKPKATNATAAGKKLNRRVEFNLYN